MIEWFKAFCWGAITSYIILAFFYSRHMKKENARMNEIFKISDAIRQKQMTELFNILNDKGTYAGDIRKGDRVLPTQDQRNRGKA